MNNELIRRSRSALANDYTVREKVGNTMVKAGGAGLGLWFAAGLIPFVSLPMLLVAMVLVGFFL